MIFYYKRGIELKYNLPTLLDCQLEIDLCREWGYITQHALTSGRVPPAKLHIRHTKAILRAFHLLGGILVSNENKSLLKRLILAH